MCKKLIQRFEMVETLINGGSQRVNFTDIPQLRTQDDQKIFIQKINFFRYLLTPILKRQTQILAHRMQKSQKLF
jgi:hypothetical protein